MNIHQYIIDWSELLKRPFSIAPSQVDGPGATTQQTSLRLYGRNYVEYGETFNENFAKMVETFASPATPSAPIDGQLWARLEMYARDYSIALTPNVAAPANAFFRYNESSKTWSSNTSNAFSVFVVSESVSTYKSGQPGSYLFSLADQKLYYWDSLYNQKPAGWIEFSFIGTIGQPTLPPAINVVAYNKQNSTWATFTDPIVASVAPVNVAPGTVWFDITINALKYWKINPSDPLDNGQWVTIPVITGGLLFPTDIDMLRDNPPGFPGYKVINLPDATDPFEAVNLKTLSDRLEAILSNVYVRTASGLLTGTLNFADQGTTTAQMQSPDSIKFVPTSETANVAVHTPITLDSQMTVTVGNETNINLTSPTNVLQIGPNVKFENTGKIALGTTTTPILTPLTSVNIGGRLSKAGYSTVNSLRWTMSFWSRKPNLANLRIVTHAPATPGTEIDRIAITDNGQVTINLASVGAALTSTQYINNVLDFVHVVIQYNATASTPAGRVRLFINGQDVALTGTLPSANISTSIGTTATHAIYGSGVGTPIELNDFYLVKDAIADASLFGQTLANRVWAPIPYIVTSFLGSHLTFENSADLGYEVNSGQSWTYTAGELTQTLQRPLNLEMLNSYNGDSGRIIVSSGNASAIRWSGVRVGTNGRGNKILSYDAPTASLGSPSDMWYQLE